MRALEGEFGELINRIGKSSSTTPSALSPGHAAGAYKVFTTIVRRESMTALGAGRDAHGDKGQISRTVRELEELGLVTRTPDPADGRSSLISPTAERGSSASQPRGTQENSLARRRSTWSIDEIHSLTRLLHALSTGETP